MLCVVYPLRERGERLTRQDAQARGVHGHLAVWGNVFDRSRSAELLAYVRERLDDGDDVLPGMSKVRLLRVKGRGFCLSGTEHVRYRDHKGRPATATYEQGWWCVPLLPG